MFLEAGYLVYILFLLVFTVLAGVRFAKTKKAATAILALLFTVGAYCFFEFSFLPLPLNMKGLQAIGDSMVPLSETVVWIPFSRLADYVASYGKEGFRYYFQTWMLSLLLAGFFMGFSFRGLPGSRHLCSAVRFFLFLYPVELCWFLLQSDFLQEFCGSQWMLPISFILRELSGWPFFCRGCSKGFSAGRGAGEEMKKCKLLFSDLLFLLRHDTGCVIVVFLSLFLSFSAALLIISMVGSNWRQLMSLEKEKQIYNINPSFCEFSSYPESLRKCFLEEGAPEIEGFESFSPLFAEKYTGNYQVKEVAVWKACFTQQDCMKLNLT